MERQAITVDISPGKDPVKRLCVTQGDKGRPLGVYIKQDGAALDLTGYDIEYSILKPDGNYYTATAEVDANESNLVIWSTAEQETPLAGDCMAQIRIMDGTVNVGTADFVEYVEKSPYAIGINSETILTNAKVDQYTELLFAQPKGYSAIISQHIRSGYYPIGIVGWYCSDNNIIVNGLKITERRSGRCTIRGFAYNNGDTAVSGLSLGIDVLWLKE